MTQSDPARPSRDTLLAMYERMLLIRRMEKQLAADFKNGQLPGAVHLYVGQEAMAVGVCQVLEDTDRISSTHRGHGHFLAKGGDPGAMMAEIYAKANGICRGMGGSMHVADFSRGIIGANGIVGGGLAITVGAAWAAKLDGGDRVAVCFFGDGAANQGVFMECLNVATLWNLPIIFVCEHNTYSEFSPSDTVTSGDIADRARAFGLPVEVVDGNDVIAVHHAAKDAVTRARAGQGPSYIEGKTYRIHGHIEAEVYFLASAYRDDDEVAKWLEKDPIDRLRKELLDAGEADPATLGEIEARVDAQVAAASAFAAGGEPADERLAFELMFVGQEA